MIRHHKLKDRLLGGIAALALSAAPVLAADGADVSAQHDAAAATTASEQVKHQTSLPAL